MRELGNIGTVIAMRKKSFKWKLLNSSRNKYFTLNLYNTYLFLVWHFGPMPNHTFSLFGRWQYINEMDVIWWPAFGEESFELFTSITLNVSVTPQPKKANHLARASPPSFPQLNKYKLEHWKSSRLKGNGMWRVKGKSG